MKSEGGAARAAGRPARRLRGGSGGLVRLLAWTGVLGLVTGCPPDSGREMHASPEATRQFVDSVNANFDRISGPLFASPARVSLRFKDEDGRTQRVLNQPASIIFEAPSCLYFDVKTETTGSVARIGADDTRYWVWIDVPEQRKLWWGTWLALETGRARPTIVPPDQLLDALMLRAPRPRLSDGAFPLLEQPTFGGPRLLYQRVHSNRHPYVARQITFHRGTRLPHEIRDFDAERRLIMHATLTSYKPIDGTGRDGPRTPRAYVIRWPLRDAELRLDVSGVRYRESDVPFCEFPARYSGPVEVLDEGPLPSEGGAP